MNLFPEAGKIGAGLGAGLGSVLGTVSDVLSAPRRALWSLFGDTTRGNEAISNMTGEDPDSVLSHVLGFGLEALTDPLTYAGGLLGKLGGNAAGKGLSNAAWKAGPGYAGDAAKLTAGVEKPESALSIFLSRASPEEKALVAREIPEGSQFLGAGHEAASYSTPSGNVVRFQKQYPDLETMGPRLNTPEVLQPVRSVSSGPITVEHLPYVQTLDAEENMLQNMLKGKGKDLSWQEQLSARKAEAEAVKPFQRGAGVVSQSAKEKGLNPWDMWPNNAAQTSEGKWLTHDANAIADPGVGIATVQPTELSQGGIGSYLARILGGQRRVRGVLEQPFSTLGQGI